MISDTCAHPGRATAFVVGGETAERAKLPQNRTTGARDPTKARARTKGATKGQFSPKLPRGMYDIITIRLC